MFKGKKGTMNQYIKDQIQTSCDVKLKILQNPEFINTIAAVSKEVISAYKAGNKTLIAGNGGSAADAQHIAAEFISKFYFDRPGLASIALTTNTSILTAIGNDYGYEKTFVRQIEANGKTGDIFFAISTSGNSKNIIEALKICKHLGIRTVGFTNNTGGDMKSLCDYCIQIPSMETPRIQESHILIGHIICAIVEKELFGNDKD